MADDIFVRDSNNQLAVNTVVSTEANVPYNYDDCFTLDTNNRRALRVVSAGGGSGGDQHNLGWYATSSDLETAHPTAEAGDWAIVGATDTVWIWDTDNSAWVDSDQKGQVISVNSKTGTVVLAASDVGAIPQYSTMPTATAEIVGNIVQFTGTTDANYTNGYFYKCVSDGQDPATYSWEAVEVQASSGGLPTQTGNAGKFLTTDGTDASWGTDISDKLLVYYDLSNSSSYNFKVQTYNGQASIYFRQGTTAKTGIVFYPTYVSINGCVNITDNAMYPIDYSDTIGNSSYKWANVYTKKINNGADITVPTTGGTMVVATPPTADGTYVLKATVSSGVVTYTWVAE